VRRDHNKSYWVTLRLGSPGQSPEVLVTSRKKVKEKVQNYRVYLGKCLFWKEVAPLAAGTVRASEVEDTKGPGVTGGFDGVVGWP